jgi:hypothetical protein
MRATLRQSFLAFAAAFLRGLPRLRFCGSVFSGSGCGAGCAGGLRYTRLYTGILRPCKIGTCQKEFIPIFFDFTPFAAKAKRGRLNEGAYC